MNLNVFFARKQIVQQTSTVDKRLLWGIKKENEKKKKEKM